MSFGANFEPLFGLDCLVESATVSFALGHSPFVCVDDLNLAVLNGVVLAFAKKRVRFERGIEIGQARHIIFAIEIDTWSLFRQALSRGGGALKLTFYLFCFDTIVFTIKAQGASEDIRLLEVDVVELLLQRVFLSKSLLARFSFLHGSAGRLGLGGAGPSRGRDLPSLHQNQLVLYEAKPAVGEPRTLTFFIDLKVVARHKLAHDRMEDFVVT